MLLSYIIVFLLLLLLLEVERTGGWLEKSLPVYQKRKPNIKKKKKKKRDPPPSMSSKESSGASSSSGYQCFEPTGRELRKAVKSYLDDDDDDHVLQTYGPNLSEWCVDKVTDFSFVFAHHYAEKLNESLSGWNTSSAVSMFCMFCGNTAFALSASVQHFDVQRVTNFSWMFGNAAIALTTSSLAGWNTSSALDMSHMFFNTPLYNISLNHFVVNRVIDFSYMFSGATHQFNQPLLSSWNTTSARRLSGMFLGATAFNQPLNHFVTNKVTHMDKVFSKSGYNQPLSRWNTSSVVTMASMFAGNFRFDQSLARWNVNRVRDFSSMFLYALNFETTPGIERWNVSSAAFMSHMLAHAESWNRSLCNWRMIPNNAAVDDMFARSGCPIAAGVDPIWQVSTNSWGPLCAVCSTLHSSTGSYHPCFAADGRALKAAVQDYLGPNEYARSAFGANISDWCVDQVTDFGFLFSQDLTGGTFNEPLTNWNTSSAESMHCMFCGNSAFNQKVDHFIVDRVTDFAWMFGNAQAFNQPSLTTTTTNWQTVSATTMAYMFTNSPFNAPVQHFVVDRVTNFEYMFAKAWQFNQSLEGWKTVSTTSLAGMFARAVRFDQEVNFLDVSRVVSLDHVFQETSLNRPVDQWNTSSVQSLHCTFCGNRHFNQPVSNWNVERVTNFGSTFSACASFNQTVKGWNTYSAQRMDLLFYKTQFNAPVAHLKVDRVSIFSYMFANTPFDHAVAGWTTKSATTMGGLFAKSSFNSDVSHFSMDRVTDISEMFRDTPFNQPLDGWRNTSSLVSMARAFQRANDFNQPLEHLIVDRVVDFSWAFAQSAFNSSLDGWKTVSATNMAGLFAGSPFDHEVSHFQVDKVTDMSYLFAYSEFNRPLTEWNTTAVRNLTGLFQSNLYFNQPLDHFDISQALDLRFQFRGAVNFNQNLCSWRKLDPAATLSHLFGGTACPFQCDPEFDNALGRGPGPFCHICDGSSSSSSSCSAKGEPCERDEQCCPCKKLVCSKQPLEKPKRRKKAFRTAFRGDANEQQFCTKAAVPSKENAPAKTFQDCYSEQVVQSCSCLLNTDARIKDCVEKSVSNDCFGLKRIACRANDNCLDWVRRAKTLMADKCQAEKELIVPLPYLVHGGGYT